MPRFVRCIYFLTWLQVTSQNFCGGLDRWRPLVSSQWTKTPSAYKQLRMNLYSPLSRRCARRGTDSPMVPLASGRKQIALYASWVFESNEAANGYHHLVRVNAYVFAAYLLRLAASSRRGGSSNSTQNSVIVFKTRHSFCTSNATDSELEYN